MGPIITEAGVRGVSSMGCALWGSCGIALPLRLFASPTHARKSGQMPLEVHVCVQRALITFVKKPLRGRAALTTCWTTSKSDRAARRLLNERNQCSLNPSIQFLRRRPLFVACVGKAKRRRDTAVTHLPHKGHPKERSLRPWPRCY